MNCGKTLCRTGGILLVCPWPQRDSVRRRRMRGETHDAPSGLYDQRPAAAGRLLVVSGSALTRPDIDWNLEQFRQAGFGFVH